jgi:2'-5' RNA ligase
MSRHFPETPPGTLRLFFALWPNDEVRAQLATQRDLMQQEYGGSHGVAADRFHLTLLFMPDFPEEQLSLLMACGDDIRVAPFDLTINARSHFKQNKVAYLGNEPQTASLFRLQERLVKRVTKAIGIAPIRDQFNPHITAVRGCRHFPSPRAVNPTIPWRVDNFVLIHSIIGMGKETHYDVLKTWTLGGKSR